MKDTGIAFTALILGVWVAGLGVHLLMTRWFG